MFLQEIKSSLINAGSEIILCLEKIHISLIGFITSYSSFLTVKYFFTIFLSTFIIAASGYLAFLQIEVTLSSKSVANICIL